MEMKILPKKPNQIKMNLTRNEKRLLLLLAVVVVFWLFYRFVFTSQKIKLDTLKKEKTKYETELSNITENLNNKDKINDEWLSLNREKESILLNYFPILDQSQIIYIVDEILKNSSIDTASINFSEPYEEDVNGIKLKTMDFSIPYEGSYDELVSLLASIRTSPRKLVIKSLTMDKKDTNLLIGEISLKVYSLESVIDNNENIVFMPETLNSSKENPFDSPIDINEKIEDDDTYVDENSNQITESDNQATENINQVTGNIEKVVVEGFEGSNIYFMSSTPEISGNVSKSGKCISGGKSLRLEYNIPPLSDGGKAYVVLDEKNIVLSKPPQTIGLWVYSYENSSVKINIRLTNNDREHTVLCLSDGVQWVGWKYLEGQPPQEINEYPLKLNRVYIETEGHKDGAGVFLIDNIDVGYFQ